MHIPSLEVTAALRRLRLCFAGGVLATGLLGGALAAPVLDLPVRCAMGQDCFIQNFFDQDPGPDYRDYACGKLSYDGHTGTDFRVRDLPAMHRGVEVLAAAPGKVIGLRDGEPDIAVSQRGKAALQGKDAGNGVVIDHGEGWVSQYSHLRQGSIRVKLGETVARGTLLGLVGESGNADFPHVELMVRHDGRAVDPFAPHGANDCRMAEDTLWSPAARAALAYQPTGLLIAGFAGEAPRRDKAEAGAYETKALAADVPLLAFWVEVFGARPGDRWQAEIVAPDGTRFAHGEEAIGRHRAIILAAIGRPPPGRCLPPGTYRAHFRFERAGQALIAETREIGVHATQDCR